MEDFHVVNHTCVACHQGQSNLAGGGREVRHPTQDSGVGNLDGNMWRWMKENICNIIT